MRVKSATRRRSVRAMALLFAAGVLACTRQPDARPPADETPPGPPSLPLGVNSNPATFMAAVENLTPLAVKNRKRAAVEGGDSITIQVAVYYTAPRLRPDTIPDSARIVARLTNTDTHKKEKTYGLLPAGRAIYYLIVDRIPGTTRPRLSLVRVPAPDDDPLTVEVVATDHQEELTLCHAASTAPFDVDFVQYKHPEPGHPCRPRGAIGSRKGTAPGGAGSTGLGDLVDRIGAFFVPRAHAQASELNEIWIDCGGCCT